MKYKYIIQVATGGGDRKEVIYADTSVSKEGILFFYDDSGIVVYMVGLNRLMTVQVKENK